MTTDEIFAALRMVSSAYAPTPILDLPGLAAHLGVAQVVLKDESRRYLGSFKSLGGTYAGLRALSRAAGTDIASLVATRPPGLPALICASDGNHGLAVAAAARHAGAPADVYLPAGVPADRVARIAAEGARITVVTGTYDDAVDAAAAAARAGRGILIADTTDDPDDQVVADVMAGYGVMAAELRWQIPQASHRRPTHAVVQAGVGGLPLPSPPESVTGSTRLARSSSSSRKAAPPSPRPSRPAAACACLAVFRPPRACSPAGRPVRRPSPSCAAIARAACRCPRHSWMRLPRCCASMAVRPPHRRVPQRWLARRPRRGILPAGSYC